MPLTSIPLTRGVNNGYGQLRDRTRLDSLVLRPPAHQLCHSVFFDAAAPHASVHKLTRLVAVPHPLMTAEKDPEEFKNGLKRVHGIPQHCFR